MCDPDSLAQTIWDYCRLGQTPEPADLIFIFGCHNLRLAERAASLFHQGFAPRILVSGGWGVITRSIWNQPEARVFQKRLVELSVPLEKILLEEQAATVHDNIRLGRQILDQNRIKPSSLLLITQPFAERRVLAACQSAWKDVRLGVTSPEITFANYPNEFITAHDLISLLSGEVQRLQLFIYKGWCDPFPIPETVIKAANQLASLGYTKYRDLSFYPDINRFPNPS